MPETPVTIERAPISSSLLNYKPKQSLSSSIKLQNVSIAQTYSTVYDNKHKSMMNAKFREANDPRLAFEKNKRAINTLNAQLKRVVKSGDTSHFTLEERRWQEFEVIEEVGILIKLRMKDRTPPCIIRFRTANKNQVFKVFYSHDVREPTE